ncbi:TadE-like protein [Geodermatophilus obscurus]|uniref:TadE-like protein n=1 Tax=Geodermatophilus obscurus TaxID=1861 RepID=A0A1M7V0Z0_9ACTN|nr:TadE/TadG family type IV pilus assembly protein [Geodermatophilus obscurus]SHN88830.1 TadE-like protein [Geodermatophilus obscurus]
MRWPRGRLGGQTGSVSLELAVLAPTLLLFIGVLVYGGRLSLATQAVQAAASQAAREASIARTQPEADTTAASVAAASLARQGLDCVTSSVSVDTTGFAAPAGTPATVTATVTCVVALADLSVPGLPGSQTVSATADSPLDTYRER